MSGRDRVDYVRQEHGYTYIASQRACKIINFPDHCIIMNLSKDDSPDCQTAGAGGRVNLRKTEDKFYRIRNAGIIWNHKRDWKWQLMGLNGESAAWKRLPSKGEGLLIIPMQANDTSMDFMRTIRLWMEESSECWTSIDDFNREALRMTHTSALDQNLEETSTGTR